MLIILLNGIFLSGFIVLFLELLFIILFGVLEFFLDMRGLKLILVDVKGFWDFICVFFCLLVIIFLVDEVIVLVVWKVVRFVCFLFFFD